MFFGASSGGLASFSMTGGGVQHNGVLPFVEGTSGGAYPIYQSLVVSHDMHWQDRCSQNHEKPVTALHSELVNGFTLRCRIVSSQGNNEVGADISCACLCRMMWIHFVQGHY